MDRKRLAGVVALVLISVLSVSSSGAAAGQVERGYALVPTPERVAGVWVESCPGVLDTSVRWATGKGYLSRFPVNGSTWGKAFSLKPAHPAADLDMSFRTSSWTWIRFASRHLGGEYGLVPAGAVEAFVCLAVGAPTPFTYSANSV